MNASLREDFAICEAAYRECEARVDAGLKEAAYEEMPRTSEFMRHFNPFHQRELLCMIMELQAEVTWNACPMCEEGYPPHICRSWSDIQVETLGKAHDRIKELEVQLEKFEAVPRHSSDGSHKWGEVPAGASVFYREG